MDNLRWGGMMVMKELLDAMNRSEKSREEEARIRQIVREIMSENSAGTRNASENDMLNRMMHLLEQNVNKQTVDLEAAKAEKEIYKAKMEELNRMMEQLMKSGGAHVSGAEGPGLTDRQRKLAEMLEELKEMRENRRSGEKQQRKPFGRGGGEGGKQRNSSDNFARKPQQSQDQGAFSKFKQNKSDSPFNQGTRPYNQNKLKDTDFEMVDHSDCKPGGFQRKPFHHDGQYKEGPGPFQKFPQYGEGDGRQGSGPYAIYKVDGQGRGSQFDNRDRQDRSDPFQNRGQPHGHGRGQFQQHRGQLHHHSGPSHQGQRSDPRNPPKNVSNIPFSPEEIQAIKAVLKQQQQQKQQVKNRKPDSNPVAVNSSKTAVKKKKKQTNPKRQMKLVPGKNDDSSDEGDDNEEGEVKSSEKNVESMSADLGATVSDTATDKKSSTESKKKKKNKDKESKRQTASEQESSSLEVFTASGFDLEHIASLNMNEKVTDMMLIAKEDGKLVTCQPGTVKEIIEFKQKYPNAQPIVVQTSQN